MTSLQTAPNVAAANMSLPANLTPQHIQEVLQVWCPCPFFMCSCFISYPPPKIIAQLNCPHFAPNKNKAKKKKPISYCIIARI